MVSTRLTLSTTRATARIPSTSPPNAQSHRQPVARNLNTQHLMYSRTRVRARLVLTVRECNIINVLRSQPQHVLVLAETITYSQINPILGSKMSRRFYSSFLRAPTVDVIYPSKAYSHTRTWHVYQQEGAKSRISQMSCPQSSYTSSTIQKVVPHPHTKCHIYTPQTPHPFSSNNTSTTFTSTIQQPISINVHRNLIAL